MQATQEMHFGYLYPTLGNVQNCIYSTKTSTSAALNLIHNGLLLMHFTVTFLKRRDSFLALPYHRNTYQCAGQWRDQWQTTESSGHQPTATKETGLDKCRASQFQLPGNNSTNCSNGNVLSSDNSLQVTWCGEGHPHLAVTL